jgi:hypothetical protein
MKPCANKVTNSTLTKRHMCTRCTRWKRWKHWKVKKTFFHPFINLASIIFKPEKKLNHKIIHITFTKLIFTQKNNITTELYCIMAAKKIFKIKCYRQKISKQNRWFNSSCPTRSKLCVSVDIRLTTWPVVTDLYTPWPSLKAYKQTIANYK